MATNTKIEWCDHTVNLWWGCSAVHTGCKKCYAEKISKRFGNNVWGENRQRKLVRGAFEKLDYYQKQALKNKTKYKIFIGSMMDIFESPKAVIGLRERYVNTGTLRDNLFSFISDNKYPDLIFLFLTKRPANIVDFIPYEWLNNTPENVWYGTSVSNNETLKYLHSLQLVSDTNLFVSFEPQTGLIANPDLKGISWVIQGGESGIKRRPFDVIWAYIMRDICKEKNIPYFFKQIDKKQAIPEDLKIREFPEF